VTEIPEHLLKRSRERRAALGLPTDGGTGAEAAPTEGAAEGGAEAAPAAGAPVPAGGAAPAPAAAAAPVGRAAPAPEPAAPPPRPDPPYVAAAKARTKIPWWAMSVVGLLPLWVLLYAWALKPSEETVAGPLGEGEEIYGSCSSCHGASGAGGVGRPLHNGEVLLTFPTLEQQASFVYTGSSPFAGKVYGDPDRPGGPHTGGSFNGSFMPQQGEKFGGALTDAEIIAVVCHERYTIGGADPLDQKYAQEFADWCAPDAPKFEAIESGESTLDEEGISTAAEA
jgi:Cytochrome c